MLPLALAAVLLAAPGGDGAPTGAGAERTSGEPSSAWQQERLDLHGWRRDAWTGLHTETFWSRAGSHYTVHSLGVGVLSSWGGRGLFLHLTGLLPLQARQDGRVYAVNDFYRLHYGGDLLTGYQWRWCATRAVEAEAGGGLHGAFLLLKGREGYRDFSASPLGLGGAAILRWRTAGRLGTWPVTVALAASTALDLYDPFHGNDLRDGFTFRLGVVVGLIPASNLSVAPR